MSTFLTAEWRKLIMAQYEVAPEALVPRMPQGVELDLYQGRCFVSLVGFWFAHVRLKGVPVPLHTNFEEINLRFYVRRPQPDGATRRGVVFVREFVPRTAIAMIARALYDEPYTRMPTQHSIRDHQGTLHVEYGWKHNARWQSIGRPSRRCSRSRPAAWTSSSPSTIGATRNARMDRRLCMA
jgi:uncharacterized protein YqjF (DUF2071 family)